VASGGYWAERREEMIRERYRKYGRIKGSGGEGGKWGLITNSTQTLQRWLRSVIYQGDCSPC